MVNSREEALAAVSAAKYPPVGTRSVGGSLHLLNFATTADDYYAHADEEILVILQCEHIRAVEDADAIFSVPGIDVIFVGPHDLAASMRDQKGKPAGTEKTDRVMKHILETCRKYGVAPGLHCASAEEARRRIAEGWQFVAVGSELRMLLDAANDVVRQACGVEKSDLAKY
jgi:4-hydroxy-2-oxoheptanedioate aldolase